MFISQRWWIYCLFETPGYGSVVMLPETQRYWILGETLLMFISTNGNMVATVVNMLTWLRADRTSFRKKFARFNLPLTSCVAFPRRTFLVRVLFIVLLEIDSNISAIRRSDTMPVGKATTGSSPLGRCKLVRSFKMGPERNEIMIDDAGVRYHFPFPQNRVGVDTTAGWKPMIDESGAIRNQLSSH